MYVDVMDIRQNFATHKKHEVFCLSSDHESKNCNIKDAPGKHQCINCHRYGYKTLTHHTNSAECPVYLSRLDDYINSIDYGN